MKKATLITFVTAVIIMFSVNMNAQIAATKINVRNTMKPTEEAVKNLKPYPEAIDSLERYVIYVEQRENEDLFEVELIPGKMLEVDCNNHRLIGELKEETVQGWGYNYHVYETEGHVASTMMMCHQPKTMKFVTGGSEMVRYNSRLPIVVYLPKGMDLKFKIWSAGEELSAEKK